MMVANDVFSSHKSVSVDDPMKDRAANVSIHSVAQKHHIGLGSSSLSPC